MSGLNITIGDVFFNLVYHHEFYNNTLRVFDQHGRIIKDYCNDFDSVKTIEKKIIEESLFNQYVEILGYMCKCEHLKYADAYSRADLGKICVEYIAPIFLSTPRDRCLAALECWRNKYGQRNEC